MGWPRPPNRSMTPKASLSTQTNSAACSECAAVSPPRLPPFLPGIFEPSSEAVCHSACVAERHAHSHRFRFCSVATAARPMQRCGSTRSRFATSSRRSARVTTRTSRRPRGCSATPSGSASCARPSCSARTSACATPRSALPGHGWQSSTAARARGVTARSAFLSKGFLRRSAGAHAGPALRQPCSLSSSSA